MPCEKANAFASSVVHPEDYDASKAAFEKCVKSKSPFEIERRLKCAGGEYLWVKTRGSPVMDFDDNVVAVYGTCTDINATMEAPQLKGSQKTLCHNYATCSTLDAGVSGKTEKP